MFPRHRILHVLALHPARTYMELRLLMSSFGVTYSIDRMLKRHMRLGNVMRVIRNDGTPTYGLFPRGRDVVMKRLKD